MMHPITRDHPLILASGSKYRAALLTRLRVPFAVVPAAIPETPKLHESGEALVKRLAQAKADAVAAHHRDRWVLGSDQVAVCNDKLLGKPGTRERAVAQLKLLSGQSVKFHTAIALVNAATAAAFISADVTAVRFRALSAEEIERYADSEDALDCAGSFKSEGLGISLCASVMSHDPTALIGLPLIAVRQLLMQAGLSLP